MRESDLKEIKSIVREAMQEELRAILVEAVEIASTPEKYPQQPAFNPKPLQKKAPVQEVSNTSTVGFNVSQILRETAQNITMDEMRNFSVGSAPQSIMSLPTGPLDESYASNGMPSFSEVIGRRTCPTE